MVFKTLSRIGFFDDPVENTVFTLIAGASILFLAASFTHLDAQTRFVLNDAEAYFIGGSSDGNDSLVFEESQVENMNWVSQTSFGDSPSGDERLFCFSVTNDRVTELRFADFIKESTTTSVSGGCTDRFGEVDGFVHTHPGGSSTLSVEDRNLESDNIKYSCLAFREMAVSPVTGEVSGLKCWRITGDGSFVEIGVKAV